MRAPAADAIGRQQRLQTQAVPAPVGGWNARDSLAAMDPQDAVILTNYFPNPSDVAVRQGSQDWATGITGNVNSLMVYNGATTRRMFGAAGANIYNVSSSGPVGAAVATGFNSDYWQYVNFATPGGNFLLAVNGVDPAQIYDGTSWSNASITGVTTNNLSNIVIWKSRVWFIEKGTLHAWYLPSASIGGAATMLDLGSRFRRGGKLIAIGTWSVDGGYGMDENLVFVTDQGEIAVYVGTDPSNASTFFSTGIYYVGAPIGTRCWCKYQGDMLIITKDGVIPLSASLMSSRVNARVNLTDKIRSAIQSAAAQYGNQQGWELRVFPAGSALLVNIPFGATQQYVMNTITGAWCNFTGWNAFCFELFNDQLFFGSNGKVLQAWVGYNDNNADIQASALQAFNYFGNTSQLKHFKMCRPIVTSNGLPALLLGVNVDFDLTLPNDVPTITQNPALWDVAKWDQALWGGYTQKAWQYCGSVGHAAALYLKANSAGNDTHWVSTDFGFEIGGIV